MYDEFYESLEEGYNHVWQIYEDNLAQGVSNEMARLVLPVATYTSMYATANLRAWLHFISLRTSEENAHWRGHPQWEIVQAAQQVEEQLKEIFPLTLAAFDKHGRVAP
jgi:thymidylate synthase (FAD)